MIFFGNFMYIFWNFCGFFLEILCKFFGIFRNFGWKFYVNFLEILWIFLEIL